MNIRIKIQNQLTQEMIVDNVVEIGDYSSDIMVKNANTLADFWNQCQVSMYASNGDCVLIPSRDMMKDEQAYNDGRMTFKQYCDKWYNGSMSACNEHQDYMDSLEDDLVTLERYEAEDWASRDAICH